MRWRSLALALAAAALLLLPACDPDFVVAEPDAGPRPDAARLPDGGPPADLDGYIEYQMGAGGIPGAAAAVVAPDGVLWMGTFGLADPAQGLPVDPHTLFIQASISKTVLAVRVMQLVEQERLDLDADVSTYLPYELRHPEHPSVVITARMLMTHTAGLTDQFLTLADVTTEGPDSESADPTVTLAEFSESYATPGGALYDDANWGPEPGTRRLYCNAAYGVLGHVVEAASGENFRAQTQASVFEAVEMDGAGWFLADVELSRVAIPTDWNGRMFVPREHNGFAFYPANSFRVSVTGLSRYARMLLSGGTLDGEPVLAQSSVDTLLELQFPQLSGSQALTFSERAVAGHAYVGHSGSTFGGSTQFLLSRGGGHAIILMTNSDAYVRQRIGLRDGGRAMERILERLDAEAIALTQE